MELPFPVEQFFIVFEDYNQAIWPAQIIAYLLGISVVIALLKPGRLSDRYISGVLALFWIWTGIVYHLVYLSTINPAAKLFAVLFIAQGVIIAVFGMVRDRFEFGYPGRLGGIAGSLLIVYAMLIYPLLGYAFGHRYPAMPMFGVAPCPATIFTFGVFVLARTVIPWYLYLLPLLWSLVGMIAAVNLGVPQDYGLGVAGIAGTAIIISNNRKAGGPPENRVNIGERGVDG